MLGAQARAAELQAAKSAAMRQKAHREAQDLALPPESAPFSLTDFARTPLTTKNKGAKAFRPLNDSDFESSGWTLGSPVLTTASSKIEEADNPSTEAVPTAPRAMLARTESYVSKFTPTHLLAPAFTPRDRVAGTSIEMTETRNDPLAVSSYVDRLHNISENVFGPDDLSPIKQEIKFAEMRQQYVDSKPARTPVHHVPVPFVPDTRIFNPHQSFHYGAYIQYSDTKTQESISPYIYGRPPMQHYLSETGTSATGYLHNQTHAERTQVFADDLMDHHSRLQQQSSDQEQLKFPIPVLENEQSYDRNSKMQSFVAAQQALAKKGKTVLHNPDLYKHHSRADPATPKSLTLATTILSPLQNKLSKSDQRVKMIARTPGPRAYTELEDKDDLLEMFLKRNIPQETEPVELTIRQQDDPLQRIEHATNDVVEPWPYEVMTENWYDLRPISTKERDTMLRSLKRIAAEKSPIMLTRPFAGNATHTAAVAEKLMREKSLTKSAKRLAMIKVVDEHEKRRRSSSVYGVIGKPISKEKVDLSSRGALKAVANIMATLYEPFNELGSDSSSVSQYTPAPKYAVDEDNAVGTSLFDNLGFGVNSAIVNAD